jgi:hypothetical protein
MTHTLTLTPQTFQHVVSTLREQVYSTGEITISYTIAGTTDTDISLRDYIHTGAYRTDEYSLHTSATDMVASLRTL